MSDLLDGSALQRWQQQPLDFIEQVIRDPETGKAFELFDAERDFLTHAWERDDNGRLIHTEQAFIAPKKSGKTLIAAAHLLTTTLVFGGLFAEGYALSNDLEQSIGRVFQAARRICEASPLLNREAEITQAKIRFPQTGGTIEALGGDYAGAAGAAPSISSFDELWAFTSERSRRLYDEMVPTPTRKVSCRLVTSYAGFANESTLLEELCARGLKQKQIGPNLYSGDGLLFAWHHEPLAPWQDERWLAEMRRSLRPNQYLRMIEARFVTSEEAFITMSAWDRCVNPSIGHMPPDRSLPVCIGIDASVKHDQSAVVAVTFDKKSQRARLVTHRVFQPSPDEPLDFESTIERTVLDLKRNFHVRKVLFDPFQMASSSARLARAGVPMEEFPQTSANLTMASQNLWELIAEQRIVLYPDSNMRLAASRAVATETPRGWRISKSNASHKIDVIVSLAQATYAAIEGQNEHSYDPFFGGDTDADAEAPPPPSRLWAGMSLEREQQIASIGMPSMISWEAREAAMIKEHIHPIGLTDRQLALVKSASASLRVDERSDFLRGVAQHLGRQPSDDAVRAAIDGQLAVNRVPNFV